MSSDSAASLPAVPVRLVWHRRDLRLHDNVLYQNLNDKTAVVSVYVLDPADFTPRPLTCLPHQWDTWRLKETALETKTALEQTALGTKTVLEQTVLGAKAALEKKRRLAVNVGPHASRLLLETLHDLRQSLRRKGGDLWIRQGDTAQILTELVLATKATEVYWHEEPGYDECNRSRRVFQALVKRFPSSLQINTHMQYTLYHPDDLPRGLEAWDLLAHPNQKRSKKKKTKRQPHEKNTQKEKPLVATAVSSSSSPSSNRRHQLVDISCERLEGMPRIMGEWRKAARSHAALRETTPPPETIHGFDSDTIGINPPGEIPTLLELLQPLMTSSRLILGLSPEMVQKVCDNAIRLSGDDSRPVHQRGGEQHALAHLEDFLSQHASSAERNLADVADNNQSSRLSHFLAWGCLSPRKIVEEVHRHMNESNGNNNSSWLISHMTMRDFFLYLCLSSGSQFYQLNGIPVNHKAAQAIRWNSLDQPGVLDAWNRWAFGNTGLPLIDAGMRELAITGYLSNRVRQNAASVLAKDLKIDWRAGAEFFQFLLADHCVGANWGNWLYFSGVGPDPKQRHFRTVSQARKYDQDGSYVKKWLPELKASSDKPNSLHEEYHLRPWDFDHYQKLSVIVPPETQYTWQDLQRLNEKGQLLENKVK